MDTVEEPIYGDIEIDDFNKIFRNQNLIRDTFGETISVKVRAGPDGTVTRQVKEDLMRAVTGKNALSELELEDGNEMSMYSQAQFSQPVDDYDFIDKDGQVSFSEQTFLN